MNPSQDQGSPQSESHSSGTGSNTKQSIFDLSKPSAQQINKTTLVIRPSNQIDLKLFISQIPKEWDDDKVKNFFSDYGEVLKAQLIRDTKTNQSKGCGFVKFASMTKAEEAKKLIESKRITLPGASHPIQIKWADGEEQRLGVDENTFPKLFVGNIPKETTEENLRDVFSQFGQVEEVTIMKDPAEGTPKGSAFIRFKTKEEAIIAVRVLDGNAYIEGSDKPMEVRFVDIKKKGGASIEHSNPVKPGAPIAPIALANTMNTTNTVAQATSLAYNRYTATDGTPYYLNPYTKQTQWDEPPPGSLVCPESGTPYVVKSPLVNIPQKANQSAAGCSLFLFFLPSEWTDSILYSYFKDYGTIVKCNIMKDRNSDRSKGFGFVTYDNPTSAQIAIQKMNGFQVGNKRIKVELKKDKDTENITNNMPSAVKFNPY